MESNIKIEVPKYHLYKKNNYEPLLLECLNCSPFFNNKSGGGFLSPKSEANGECDAIGKNGFYSIDFKCLISEDGAKNVNETSLTEQKICPGITVSGPSKASIRGISSLPFANIWGFLVSGCLDLNENSEIKLKDEKIPNMRKTIMSLNRTIYMKKNLLYFLPTRFVIDDPHDIEILCNEAKKALSLISRARAELSGDYETYYALLMNSYKMILFSENLSSLECIELTSINSWKRLTQGF